MGDVHHLRYQGIAESLPLPDWAEFLLELGEWFHSQQRAGVRRVCAVTLPARDYAAVIVAAGFVCSSASQEMESDATREHFARMMALPLGAWVTVQTRGRLWKGKIVRHDERNGSDYLVVQSQADLGPRKSGALTDSFCERIAACVQICDSDCDELPAQPTGRKLPRAGSFLSSVLGIPDPARFIMSSSLQLTIVGPIGRIREEAADDRFGAVRDGGRPVSGCLQELLRVKSLLNGGEPFRIQVVPHTTRRLAAARQSLEPVVFDGATAFLKCRHLWHRADWMVLLDRTDRHFADAAAQINLDFLSRGPDADSDAPGKARPPAVEMLYFAEPTHA